MSKHCKILGRIVFSYPAFILVKSNVKNIMEPVFYSPMASDRVAIFSTSVLDAVALSSIVGKIAFGPNAGKYVTRIGSGFGYQEEIPLAQGRRCFSVNGLSLHANTAINTQQRDRLEKLIEYVARGPSRIVG